MAGVVEGVAARGGGQPPRPTATVAGLTKHFQAVTALEDVTIDFFPGQVHVLFGENGAGKSTLIKVLAGVHRPDAGTIKVTGAPFRPASPKQAREQGVTAVFQDPALVPQLSVAENISLGREPLRRGLMDRRAVAVAAREALDQVASDLDPATLVRDLSRAEQQIVEIARALHSSVQILILDEPTASLTDEEADRLFMVVDELRAHGLAIIYITHRLREIRRVGDHVSVLRDGRLVATRALADVDDTALIALMTGREVGDLFPTINSRPGEVGLDLINVSSEGVHDVSITARRGEVVGLAGLVGSGKDRIGKLCFGLAHLTAGRLLVGDSDLGPRATPAQRLAQGVMYYPSDRRKDGLIAVRPARESVTLSAIGSWVSRGLLRRRTERSDARNVLARLNLRPLAPEALPSTFSGGNQQKIVLARGFIRDYAVHVFDEPTAGVDVGARVEIYDKIKELAESGSTVLLISSDLPEVLNLAHRAYVITEGRVAVEVSGEELREEIVLPHFFPHHHPGAAA